MRRTWIGAVLVMGLILAPSEAAFAQEQQDAQGEEEGITVADLFQWATESPPDWGEGLWFAGLGLVGALVILFTLVGGAVPGTAGAAQIDADQAVLRRLSQRLDQLVTANPPNAPAIDAVRATVNEHRDDLTKERWRQFAIAGILYALLGAFFASALAKDILQALVLGATWTGLIGSLGLKKDYEVRKEIKDETIQKLEAKVETVAGAASAAVPNQDWGSMAATSDWVVTPDVARAI
jgi:hypothetical protein